MFSKYERQKDMRTYVDKRTIFVGPSVLYPAERIKPTRAVQFKGEGMPTYTSGGEAAADPAPAVDAGGEEEEE